MFSWLSFQANIFVKKHLNWVSGINIKSVQFNFQQIEWKWMDSCPTAKMKLPKTKKKEFFLITCEPRRGLFSIDIFASSGFAFFYLFRSSSMIFYHVFFCCFRPSYRDILCAYTNKLNFCNYMCLHYILVLFKIRGSFCTNESTPFMGV